MNFLDIPAELFQRIVEYYVTDVGVREAWLRREVCRTFDCYITEEIFGNQSLWAILEPYHYEDDTYLFRYRNLTNKEPEDESEDESAGESAEESDKLFNIPLGLSKLLKRGLAIYIELRSMRPSHQTTMFSLLVNSVIEILVSVSCSTAEEPGMRKAVAQVVSQSGRNAYTIVTTEHDPKAKKYWTEKCFADDIIQYALFIAVGVQHLDLMRRLLLSRFRASMWHKSWLFGLPLHVAIPTRNLELIKEILDVMHLEHNNFTPAMRVPILNKMIKRYRDEFLEPESDRGNYTGILYHLTDFFLKEFTGLPNIRACQILFDWAIQVQYPPLVARVLQARVEPLLWHRFYPRLYFNRPPNPDILELLVQHEILDVHGAYDFYHVERHKKQEYDDSLYLLPYNERNTTVFVLHHAVFHDNAETVRKALDMGACPDGVDWPQNSSLLALALDRGNGLVVNMLFEQGPGRARSPSL